MEPSDTALCFRSWGNERNQQKERVVSQKQSEERFQKKLSPTSNATATSSEKTNEDQRENLSPRTSLVISTRAVTTAEEKNLMAVDPKGTVSTAAHKNSLGEELKKDVVLGGVLVSVVFKEEQCFSTSIC